MNKLGIRIKFAFCLIRRLLPLVMISTALSTANHAVAGQRDAWEEYHVNGFTIYKCTYSEYGLLFCKVKNPYNYTIYVTVDASITRKDRSHDHMSWRDWPLSPGETMDKSIDNAEYVEWRLGVHK